MIFLRLLNRARDRRPCRGDRAHPPAAAPEGRNAALEQASGHFEQLYLAEQAPAQRPSPIIAQPPKRPRRRLANAARVAAEQQ